MPRNKDFKKKTEIETEIRTTKTDLATVTKLKDSEDWVAIDEYWFKLAAGGIVTSDPAGYSNAEKAVAQQQSYEHENNEERALKCKERLQREQTKLEKRLEELEDFKNQWTGPD
ncbi:uncharacterized protein FFUJ_08148 [Fusarium fujikuroi IMI 58289]|uniref:Uncharacterized protein n=2 Tax=Fusarium fujikuroi TaxID=5127 RepID=S0EH95_GIBF5|nr:uncharacterized protein FFUJ_08148 [Fusarium fujikuroi IMI 58289]KLP22343.1 uncharacterized protein LW94_4745 [Fusarium fujikuroi]CCT71748.1 uncharacterized protein FFUJ_08148 [Fusarium fujikuroi IMI 58289]SCO20689.1 uncharacterized protein FFM5_12477 [Fusarium fujikuroi]SCO51166.1 uncharacterized protein FFMR_10392 [Fusarium fujikuroi]VTT78551.1 unnamed protein product [Fusarium fujikuroi]